MFPAFLRIASRTSPFSPSSCCLRDPKNIAPNCVPPRLTGGSIGGRRPLNLVTNQQPFRASTVQVVRTESLVSETSSQESPTMSPGPATLPHLPPGSNSRNLDGDRLDTPPMKPIASASEERNPPQPLNTAPINSPRPDPGPAQHEPAGTSEGMHAEVWPTYNEVSQEFDEKGLKQWNDELDVILIFVSLVVRASGHQFRSD